VYIFTRTKEHLFVVLGILLSFIPLVYSFALPILTLYTGLLLLVFSNAFTASYFRIRQKLGSVLLGSLFVITAFLEIFLPSNFLFLSVVLYFLSIEITIRTICFEFMVRKGFRKTIPLIFVNVLYGCCSLLYFVQFFELTILPILLLSFSMTFSSVILVKNSSLLWQLLLAFITTICMFSYEFHKLLTIILLMLIV